MAVAGVDGAQKAWQTAAAWYRDRMAYTVTIDESDPIYGDVHGWLLELMPTERQRALVVSSRDARNTNPDPDGQDRPEPLRLLFNDRRRRWVTIDGHRVTVEVRTAEDVPRESKRIPDKCIQFSTHTKAAQDAVLGHVRRIHETKAQRQPVLRIVNQWGGWSRRADLPLRTLDSIVLPPSQKQAITDDLRDFLAAEDEYNRLALPWHRGYLFHGQPGTGKTSLVKGLAHEFKLDLWYVPLGDLTAEASLINLLAEVSPRSLLLLEDVDTVHLTHERDEHGDTSAGQKTINLSSLLNALDGVATPHGLITVMTTNHYDRLDKALTRAGRMDRIEELAMPTWREVDAMYARFYGPHCFSLLNAGFPSLDQPCPLTQADVSEIFKRHLGAPGQAAMALGDAVVAT